MLPHVNLPEDFKETEIGPIPVDWDVMPLSQVAEHNKITINPQSYRDEVFDYYSIPACQVSDKPALEHGQQRAVWSSSYDKNEARRVPPVPSRHQSIDVLPCSPIVVVDVLVDLGAFLLAHFVGVAFGESPDHIFDNDPHCRTGLLALSPVEH